MTPEKFYIAFFVIGFVIQTLNTAATAVKETGYPNIKTWFVKNWIVVVTRLVLSIGLWTAYVENPVGVDKLLGKFGIQFDMALPITRTTSFFVGYASNSLLDLLSKKIPWLAHYIPVTPSLQNPSASGAIVYTR